MGEMRELLLVLLVELMRALGAELVDKGGHLRVARPAAVVRAGTPEQAALVLSFKILRVAAAAAVAAVGIPETVGMAVAA